MKHSIWYTLNKWKVKIILLVTISSSLGIGISQSEAVAKKINIWAENYINARVDYRMITVTKEVNELKEQVRDMNVTVEKNNDLMQKLIIVITSKKNG